LIQIYKLTSVGYAEIASINENDATVEGDTKFADWLRAVFSDMENRGYPPVDHMDKIRSKLEANYRNGYYYVT
jgi:hypothetical protein